MLIALYIPVQAQPYVRLNSFTSNEGLASNHIYDIVEDNKGFLWLATDNGVSRFDGKYFQNFSVKNGLPANDVLQIRKDSEGIIWVNCYKQLPAYFDEGSKRFVTLKSRPVLADISKTLYATSHLPNGGIRFYNQLGHTDVKGKKAISWTFDTQYKYKMDIDGKTANVALSVSKLNKKFRPALLITTQSKTDSAALNIDYSRLWSMAYHKNGIYLFCDEGKMYKISNIHTAPLTFKLDSLKISGNSAWYKLTDQYIHITNTEGDVMIYDNRTLAPVNELVNQIQANCAYVDRSKNLWVGTLDKGLFYYSTNGIKKVQVPEGLLNQNFLSISVNNLNETYAGNYYGQLLKTTPTYIQKLENKQIPATAWIRKIFALQNQLITISDLGYSINFTSSNSISNHPNGPVSLKTAVPLNDSIVIIGSNSGLIKLNINNKKTAFLSSVPDRTLNLVRANADVVYYIGPKGLYRYRYSANKSNLLALPNAAKLSSLAFGPDSTLWASTVDGRLLVIKNDQVLATISYNVGLPENMTCMLAIKNKVWIGSKTGISIIDYRLKGKHFKYNLNNLSRNDGLPSNTINDFAFKNDTVYVATENGIGIIAANYKNPKFEIIPALIGIKINQRDTNILQTYQLKSSQNNITLQFAGIDLSGHFKNMQYAIDKKLNWSNLIGNTLNIQLNNGHHQIYVRAIDVNRQISDQTLVLAFDIETPFFKTIWFWAAIAIAITGLIFWLYHRRKFVRQKTSFDQQLALELQRQKITADLHDDIGATLSSLQLNSAVASQLIHKDIKQTERMLHKIENQSKNLADKIGDIIWSMKPAKDEFMTLSSRIKNFANDILGATNINYTIQIDPKTNRSIQNITARKNIVLIAKEAINNIAKYSKASEAKINMHIHNNVLYIHISDNGIGFDQTAESGNGLSNMRKRTIELGGQFELNSTLNQGTSIVANIPIVP